MNSTKTTITLAPIVASISREPSCAAMLIWRGWGLLAFPLLVLVTPLVSAKSPGDFLAGAALSLLASAACISAGYRWNQERTDHAFWFIPLQVWGWIALAVVAVYAVRFFLVGAQQGLDTEAGLLAALVAAVSLLGVATVGVRAARANAGNSEGWQDYPTEPAPRPRRRQRGLMCPNCGHPAPGTATPKWCGACEQPWSEAKPKAVLRRTSWRVKGIRTELNLPWTMDVVAASTEEATSIAVGLGLEVHSVEPLD